MNDFLFDIEPFKKLKSYYEVRFTRCDDSGDIKKEGELIAVFPEESTAIWFAGLQYQIRMNHLPKVDFRNMVILIIDCSIDEAGERIVNALNDFEDLSIV